MIPAYERFAVQLPDYLASLQSSSEDGRRILFLDLVRGVFGVDLARFQIEERVYGGRVDALLGALVFEFKRDLARDQDDAEAQLSRYITDLHRQHPGRSFTAVATDGVRIVAFSPEYNARGEVETLQPTGEFDLGKKGLDATAAFLWLDPLLASFRERRPATTQSVLAGLGPASVAFRTAHADLQRVYRRLRDDPALKLRVGQWRKYLALVYGEETGDDDLFLKHTYLATVARLLAFLRLGMPSILTLEDLEGMIVGRYFETRATLVNFVEDDFFTWFLFEPARQEGRMLANRLLNTLQSYDFSQVHEDVLKELYQGLISQEDRHGLGQYYTPDWLAELMLRDELNLPEDPRRSILDPSCGSGTFLFIAVRLIREALEREGMAATDILAHLLDNVVGMDVHPLAVTIARTNYLLALGDLLQARGDDEITIPVYLADAIHLPATAGPLRGTGPYAIEVEPRITLGVPQAVGSDPIALDYVLNFMKGKYGQNALRFIALNPRAKERNLNAFREFLIAPGNRHKQAVLQPEEAEVLVQTQDVLLRLMQEGKDTLWFFILRNALRPLYLERRKFDVVAGNPPWLSLRYVHSPVYTRWLRTQIVQEYQLIDRPSRGTTYLNSQMELATLFFARAADLYLKDGGQIAFVMPRSVMGSGQQHARFTGMSFKDGLLTLGLRNVLDLDGVKPLFNVPACVLVAQKGKWPDYPVPGKVVSGDLVVKNRPLAEAKNRPLVEARPMLEVRPTAYQRVEGRLVALRQAQGERGNVRGELVEPRSQARSYYYDKFYQGAIIVPRNLWFVRPAGIASLGGNQGPAPFFETDPEGTRQAKAPWKDIRMEGNVEVRFLYATLPSGQLVPFGYTRLSPVILPLMEEGGRYVLLNVDGATERSFYHLAEWLRKAEEHWQANAKRGEGGSLKAPSIVERLDYLHNLTRQSPRARYRVLYNAAGTNLCAAVVDTSKATGVPINGEPFPVSGFLCEHKMYVYHTDDASEANFLQAVFNSPILNALIKPSQTVGLWGERDIEKRAVQFPIPQFDPQNANHLRLAELGQQCTERVQEVIPELAARYRSVGKLRGEVRRLLAAELAEIDALARQVLGLV